MRHRDQGRLRVIWSVQRGETRQWHTKKKKKKKNEEEEETLQQRGEKMRTQRKWERDRQKRGWTESRLKMHVEAEARMAGICLRQFHIDVCM